MIEAKAYNEPKDIILHDALKEFLINIQNTWTSKDIPNLNLLVIFIRTIINFFAHRNMSLDAVSIGNIETDMKILKEKLEKGIIVKLQNMKCVQL